MTNYTKYEKENAKRFAKKALDNCLRFSPALNKIVLLETSGSRDDFDYVMFRINGNPEIEYQARYDWVNGWRLTIIKNDDYANAMNI